MPASRAAILPHANAILRQNVHQDPSATMMQIAQQTMNVCNAVVDLRGYVGMEQLAEARPAMSVLTYLPIQLMISIQSRMVHCSTVKACAVQKTLRMHVNASSLQRVVMALSQTHLSSVISVQTFSQIPGMIFWAHVMDRASARQIASAYSRVRRIQNHR